jgi:hypothetical protein
MIAISFAVTFLIHIEDSLERSITAAHLSLIVVAVFDSRPGPDAREDFPRSTNAVIFQPNVCLAHRTTHFAPTR